MTPSRSPSATATWFARGSLCGSLGVPLYAKIEILGVEDGLVHLKTLANVNCGYKDLTPGVPDD